MELDDDIMLLLGKEDELEDGPELLLENVDEEVVFDEVTLNDEDPKLLL